MVRHIAAQPALDLFTIHSRRCLPGQYNFDWRPRMVDPVKPDQNGANRSKMHVLSFSYFHGLDKLTLLFVLTFIPPLILSEPQPSARNTLVWRLELPDPSDPSDDLFDKRKAWLHLEMKWRLGNALVFGSLCSHVAAWIYLLRAQYRPVAGFYDRMLADRLLLIKLRAHDDADTFYAERRETLMAQDHDTFQ
ncbi:predicted protein [Histoplasma capsulatum G186AR]|uniref:Uncharacterized protein n=1 Tax=Ajellomyces capsulatus (strain G186AR / H82 / ATCC MYA-2454 / RMSCC 2432) TaxID=447093 RepID=C0NUF3_AJECG|nr:uncharacterized protein HCBG_06984 [Histoplasma capsulatum G186AR]EEH05033.1 predicted protein [Histoplasma capsulatum G186AR]